MKIWNNDPSVLLSRKNAGIAGQRKDQFQWHTAVDVIRKVNKDIKITKNGSKSTICQRSAYQTVRRRSRTSCEAL